MRHQLIVNKLGYIKMKTLCIILSIISITISNLAFSSQEHLVPNLEQPRFMGGTRVPNLVPDQYLSEDVLEVSPSKKVRLDEHRVPDVDSGEETEVETESGTVTPGEDEREVAAEDEDFQVFLDIARRLWDEFKESTNISEDIFLGPDSLFELATIICDIEQNEKKQERNLEAEYLFTHPLQPEHTIKITAATLDDTDQWELVSRIQSE